MTRAAPSERRERRRTRARTSARRAVHALLGATLLLAPLAAAALSKHAAFAAQCGALAGTTIPAQLIALPTRGAQIDSAAMVPATATGNQSGEYCRVTGSIHALQPGTPDIHFDLNLPLHWNGRALQIGGGGYDGVVVSGTGVTPFSPDHAPLAVGYATFGDDSGHTGNSALADFGLVNEAVINFGFAHLKKTHDVVLALIGRVYGRTPERMYFGGGSTGGREGYTVMQRYPDDYDGVIANSPALNFSGVRLLGVALGRAEYGVAGGYLPPALLERVYQRTLEVCDKLDGAADGIVSNVEECRKHEQEIIDSLRCASAGATGSADAAASGSSAACLTEPQIATLRVLRDGLALPYPLAWNSQRYAGYNVFQGTRLTGMLGLGHEPARQALPGFLANGYLFTQGDSYIRYFVTQNANFNSLNFDPAHPGRYRQQLFALSETIGSMDTDLSRYIARGGKLITLQGLADEVISPNQTIAYYNALIARFGSEKVDSFMRLYMVPGYQHGNGVFIPSLDLLGALDNWVTHGVSPQTLTATDIAAPTNGRTRPLCRYPMFPRYLGKGNVNRASSFVCAGP
ncbi:MAG: tannase/feruloyl esterase family alpha/beta hydrolase [Paraburkholderia sp.]|uniref:tannase/feruloyl esterase family alpha/beta hydrolase n=1 Tax=Burkholderia sp. 4M9327F10 TaxID=2502223 RepID=UPI0010F7453D|nr:tannase/feruloyl esterase family alpha/beta hydrolase [Burkholderia sp. 4M9327F10]